MIDTILRREAEIDEKIAQTYYEWQTALADNHTAQNTVRRLAFGYGRMQGLPTYREAKGRLEQGEGYVFRFNTAREHDEADRAIRCAEDAGLKADEALATYEEADAQYGGWTRFFLVKNNNGHIHRTMNCQTCFVTTQFGWLTDLSGLTEKEAVDAYGPLLCTVCFPSAPVEWTIGKKSTDHCPGLPTGQAVSYFTGRRTTYYRTCSECGEQIAETASGALRKHKPKKK
jgi:hypothetical protein